GTANWSFANPNYVSQSGTATIVISKANADITVTPYTVTYDAAAHTSASSATGVKGEALAGLNVTATTHTNAGAYNGDAWTFTDVTGNYNNDNGTVDDSIAKINATITVTPYSVNYDGTAHT